MRRSTESSGAVSTKVQLFDAQLAAVAARQAATAEIKKQGKQDVLLYSRRLPDCPDHSWDRHRTADE
jgi:hypothetical protein